MAPMRTAAFGNVVTWPPLLEKIFREFAKLAAKLESTPVIETSTGLCMEIGRPHSRSDCDSRPLAKTDRTG